MTPTLGSTIRTIRIARGLSQRALAELAGVSTLSVLRVEHDRQAARLSPAAQKICVALGLSLDAVTRD